MINVQLSREKSMIEHRSSNILHPGENVARAQPSLSHKEDEIQNSNFEHGSNKIQVKSLKRMIGNQQQKESKRSQQMSLRVGIKKSR